MWWRTCLIWRFYNNEDLIDRERSSFDRGPTAIEVDRSKSAMIALLGETMILWCFSQRLMSRGADGTLAYA
jgi:hypothetical protein